MKPTRWLRSFFLTITRNPLSLLGTVIATASAAVALTVGAIESISKHHNPYIGIIVYLVLPAIFVVGLVLIPWGLLRQRKREAAAREQGKSLPALPVIDLNLNKVRTRVLIFLALTMVNVVLIATATYKGIETMDSTEFCGTTCHTVMQPEHTAHQNSPHSRVKCVSCHIGPGANWFVKAKLSGSWQVVSVLFDLYPRPIPTPVHALRPARDTCEQCHWPTKFVGDQLKVLTHYEEDEENTALKTALLLRVGGLQGRESQGIHWHVDPAVRIRYRADPTREIVHEIELTREDGTVTLYHSPQGEANGNAEVEEDEESEWREMDCVDCHNRPTHIYQLPHEAIDRSMLDGRIARTLPYAKRESMRVLQADYSSHDEARQLIPAALRTYYVENYPEVVASQGDRINAAGLELAAIYTRNVFPSMKVDWGTYPDHIGHENYPGCFRCHNDEHESEDGQVVSQDCDTCHSLLAFAEEEPEILELLNP